MALVWLSQPLGFDLRDWSSLRVYQYKHGVQVLVAMQILGGKKVEKGPRFHHLGKQKNEETDIISGLSEMCVCMEIVFEGKESIKLLSFDNIKAWIEQSEKMFLHSSHCLLWFVPFQCPISPQLCSTVLPFLFFLCPFSLLKDFLRKQRAGTLFQDSDSSGWVRTLGSAVLLGVFPPSKNNNAGDERKTAGYKVVTCECQQGFISAEKLNMLSGSAWCWYTERWGKA